MSELITMTNGVVVDLHTKKGAYEYVGAFLDKHGADGQTCAALGTLFPTSEDKTVEISEGKVKKGGVNKRPTTPPPPPVGQGGTLSDADCGIGELLERREAALCNFMRLDELLYFTMGRKISEPNAVNERQGGRHLKPNRNPT